MDYYESGGYRPPVKEKKKWGFGLGFLVGIMVAVTGMGFGARLYATATHNYLVVEPWKIHGTAKSAVIDKSTADKIDELLSYVDLFYNDEYHEDDVRDAIYKGTLNGLGDPYSVYYTPDEYKDMQVTTRGKYYGIGAGMMQDAKTMEVTVTKVYKGTPAEEAGLKNGDQLLSVEDTKATSMELSLLVKKIRGEEGTKVHLKVYRKSINDTLEFDVERRNISLPSVESEMLENKTGYIQITEFQDETAKQFSEALKQLQEDGMEKLLIDLRDNPGGLITSVTDILDIILPEGTLVYTEDKYGKRETYSSDADCISYPIAVLINGNSASASEIFAGAIKDYDYGTLIGTKTFGKGIVQTLFPLEDGSAVKITTSKYFTPKGNYIHGAGIEPDIELEYEYSGPDRETYEKQYDNQLQRALEELK